MEYWAAEAERHSKVHKTRPAAEDTRVDLHTVFSLRSFPVDGSPVDFDRCWFGRTPSRV